MATSCDCVKKVNQKLSDTVGKKCSLNIDLFSGRILIPYFYDEENSRGNMKQKSGNIRPSHCPFCGKLC